MADPVLLIAARLSAWAVLAGALVSAFLIADRWSVLGRRRVAVTQLAARLRTVLRRGEPAELESFCGQKSSPVMNTLRRFALLWRQAPAARAAVFEQAVGDELDAMERRLPLLATLAGVIPMLGIFTLLAAYRDHLSGVPNPVRLEAGPLDAISIAAAALLTGIAALISYNLFAVRVRSHMRDIERLSLDVLAHLDGIAGPDGGEPKREAPVFDDDEFFRKKV